MLFKLKAFMQSVIQTSFVKLILFARGVVAFSSIN